MRLYAVADLHGRKSRLSAVLDNFREHRPDAIVAAGDLGGFPGIGTGSFLAELSRIPVPVFTVTGNADGRRVQKGIADLPNLVPLHLTKVPFMGLTLVGISGAVPIPFATRLALREREIMTELAPLVNEATLLVAHVPPRGTRDRVLGRFSAGSGALSDLVREKKPRAVICGHIHEQAGTGFMGETLVVNCAMGPGAAGALIDILPDGSIQARML